MRKHRCRPTSHVEATGVRLPRSTLSHPILQPFSGIMRCLVYGSWSGRVRRHRASSPMTGLTGYRFAFSQTVRRISPSERKPNLQPVVEGRAAPPLKFLSMRLHRTAVRLRLHHTALGPPHQLECLRAAKAHLRQIGRNDCGTA